MIRISDEVKPGDTFSINGGGMTDDANLDVAVEPDSGSSPSSPSGSALHPAIVQRDRNGDYVVATLPSTASPGVYNVWVKNVSGGSTANTTFGPSNFMYETE